MQEGVDILTPSSDDNGVAAGLNAPTTSLRWKDSGSGEGGSGEEEPEEGMDVARALFPDMPIRRNDSLLSAPTSALPSEDLYDEDEEVADMMRGK